MSIFYVGYHLEKLVESGRYYFWKEVEKRVNLIHYGFLNPSTQMLTKESKLNKYLSYAIFRKLYPKVSLLNDIRNMRKIVNKIKPDVLVIEDRFLYYCKNDIGLDIPKVLILNDEHNVRLFIKRLAAYINKNNIVLIISKLKYPIPFYEKNLGCKVEWLPWSVNTKIFRSYDVPFKYDIFSLGIISPVYTLRYEIKKLPNVAYQKYPIIPFIGELYKSNIREEYAKQLSMSKIFIFGNSIYLQAIQKYFEGMASDCMVVAPTPRDWKDLHFSSGSNFIHVNQDLQVKTINEVIDYYLDNEEERRSIVANANDTVKKYHTVEKRVDEFMALVKRI